MNLSFPDLLDFPKSQRDTVVVDEYAGVGIECNPPKHFPGTVLYYCKVCRVRGRPLMIWGVEEIKKQNSRGPSPGKKKFLSFRQPYPEKKKFQGTLFWGKNKILGPFLIGLYKEKIFLVYHYGKNFLGGSLLEEKNI